MPAVNPDLQDSILHAASIQLKADLLEHTFNTIQQQRMADVPIVNDVIKVHAIGFQPWQKSYIGVLVTPWFMNLILLPGKTQNWDDLQELSKQTHCFPSGKYTFLTGYEDTIGKYQMCSLFSPMFEFADDSAAVETAQIVIRELMNDDNIEQGDIDSAQIEGIWDGSVQHPDNTPGESDIQTDAQALSDQQKQAILEQPSLTQKLEQPISRRDLLRGTLLRGDKKP